MKKMMLKIITFIMLTEALFIPNVSADFWTRYESGGFKYWLEDGSAFIRQYTGSDENVVIPSEIDGYPVKGIGSMEWNSPFFGNQREKRDKIKTVTIPEGIEYIGNSAFMDCDSLTEITIPESVISVGERVFNDCDKLITANVLSETIGVAMFSQCSSLTTVNLNEKITIIPSGAFANCSALTTIIIPEKVTTIDSRAFSFCTSLQNVIIPENVYELNYGACQFCFQLKNVIFKGGNTKFKEEADDSPISGLLQTFAQSDNLSTFYAFKGSQAEEYSLKNDLEFVPGARVEVNGESVKTDVPPIIKNNRVLIPMRAIFEALGAEINWNGETRTVLASTEKNSVRCEIDNNLMTVNGVAKTLDVAPEILMNRTLVPARAVSESLGANVEWDEARQTVVIRY